MPLEKKDMDTVFALKCKLFLKKMEKGKFYCYSELSDIILNNSLHRPKLNPESEDPASLILDIAYVEAVIQAQYAVGNLRCGEKGGERYYCKV